jgi:hypothetical protein
MVNTRAIELLFQPVALIDMINIELELILFPLQSNISLNVVLKLLLRVKKIKRL